MTTVQDLSRLLEHTAGQLKLGAGTRVLQLGAADGAQGDPVQPLIRNHRDWYFWRVEPRLVQYKNLVRTNEHSPNVVLYQACVAPTAGEVSLYEFIPSPHLPAWAPLLASLDRGMLERQNARWKDAEQPYGVINELKVYGEPLVHMLESMALRAPDVVIADMGGFEHLGILPILHTTPRIICYENCRITLDWQQKLDASLRQAGYQLVLNGHDALWTHTGTETHA